MAIPLKQVKMSNMENKVNEIRSLKKTGDNRTSGQSSSSLKQRQHHLQKRPVLVDKENVPRSKPGHQQGSIKDFFADLPRSKVDKKRKLVIYDETRISKKSKTISTQTVQVDENIGLMCSEKPTEKYWELLAEERRCALKEALQENKELAIVIEEKDETIDKLKVDVERLEEKANHADYLASVIEKLGEGCLDEEEPVDKDSSPSIEEASSPCEESQETSSCDENDKQTDEEQTIKAFDTTNSNCEDSTPTESETEKPDCVFNTDSDKENIDPLEPVEYSPVSD